VRYPGGKGKCFQQIINLLPPHQVYIEPFLGGGAVLRNKLPAERSIGIDRDSAVIENWRRNFPELADYRIGDAFEFFRSQTWTGGELVYCDPPYLPSSRKRSSVYRHDLSESDHIRLVELLVTLPCQIVLSGYRSALYDKLLRGWGYLEFSAKAQDGIRVECVWFNYEAPKKLHDGRYIGSTFRERQNVQRRLGRLQNRIHKISKNEQHILADWLCAQLGQEGS
jgi:site-specific DNA-adenine methylase